MNKGLIAAITATGLGLPVLASEKVLAGEPSTASRQISIHDGDIVPLNVERGYVTIIELPETAIAVICGDCQAVDQDGKVAQGSAGKWIAQIVHDTNKVSIAAVATGGKTNANVMGVSGKLYSFSLKEISQSAGEHADLLILLSQDGGTPALLANQVRYVPASTAESYKNEAANSQRALKEEQARSEAAVAEATRKTREAVAENSHEYTWSQNAKASETFGVSAIYLLDGFTVIKAKPQEAPALYEVRDGKDSLIQFTFTNGKYVAPKQIDNGYLRIGKSKLVFRREAKNG